MSRFVKCDRCSTEDNTMGTISLPPGWQKICGADLCEPCCALVHDFIRFKSSDAESLPVEPIPAEFVGPTSDKLFEIAPEPQVSADSQQVSDHASDGKVVPNDVTDGDPNGKTQPVSAESIPLEATVEERHRTKRNRKKCMQGQDAIQPDKRTKFPHGHNAEPGVAQ